MTHKNTRHGFTQINGVGQVLPDNALIKGHPSVFIIGKNNPYCQVEPDLHKWHSLPKGFTLIELLVVVLIIAVLSAIAVPQYQKVIIKSRVWAMITFTKNIADAQELFYLHHGSYTGDIKKLEMVTIPAFCKQIPYNYNGTMLSCDKYFVVDMDLTTHQKVSLNFCPGKNTDWNSCYSKRDFQIYILLPTSTRKQRVMGCWKISTFGQKICNIFASEMSVVSAFPSV